MENTPRNSVYHYDSALTSSPKIPGGGNECYRYSLPLNHCVTSQESDDIPNRRQCTENICVLMVSLLFVDSWFGGSSRRSIIQCCFYSRESIEFEHRSSADRPRYSCHFSSRRWTTRKRASWFWKFPRFISVDNELLHSSPVAYEYT